MGDAVPPQADSDQSPARLAPDQTGTGQPDGSGQNSPAAANGAESPSNHSRPPSRPHSTSHRSTPEADIDAPPPIAIEQLVDEYYAEIYRYAFRLAGNSADAADITQQAFLNAQSHLASLREAHKSRGWLYAILRNTFLKSRRKKTPASAGNLEFELDHVPDPAMTGSELADFDSEELQAAIAELPEEFRLVILMFYFEESSYKEIAQALEIPEGTVMSRLSRAKGHLRKKLSG